MRAEARNMALKKPCINLNFKLKFLNMKRIFEFSALACFGTFVTGALFVQLWTIYANL
jgi:hypothetical protein